MAKPKICEDNLHCGDCSFIKPYGKPEDLTALCLKSGNDLMWHDFWIAECGIGNETTGGSANGS